MTELRLGQINTVDIDTSEFASANSVNTVQSNVTSLTSDVSTISANLNALPDSAANDYTTYSTLSTLIDTVSSNASSHSSAFWEGYADSSALSGGYISNAFTVVSGVGAYFGDGGSWTQLATLASVNTVQDNVSALDNNAWVNANDYTTYNTISGLIDTVNANVEALPDSAANDYSTYTTVTGLIDTVQDNVDSLTSTVDSADANLYNTYTSLSASIDTVQDNVGAGGSSGNVTVFGASDQFTVAGANTFTLSQSVTNSKDIIVSLSGVIQYPTVGYTVSGTTLTIANTTPLKAGLDLEVRHLIGEPGARGNAWEEVSSNASLNGRSRIIVDTTSSAVTLTLPLNPSLGDEVRVIDGAGNSSNNAITLYGNGANIEAETSNVLIDVDRSAFTMIYYNTYHGWLFGEK